MTSWRFGARGLILVCLFGLVAALGSLAAPSGQDRAARPHGEPVLEPPTLRSLGVYWIVAGDADGDARVDLEYRRQGESAWRRGAPLFRVEPGAHAAEGRSLLAVPEGAHLFAGSLLLLRPDTPYELKLRLLDGGAVVERPLRARTRAEPRLARPVRTLHVIPGRGGGQGTADDPFVGLDAAQAAARPGDLFLLRPGRYHGTFRITRSGEPGRPIVWRGSGATATILDGQGDATARPGRAVDAVGAHDVWLERLGIRRATHGVVAHNAARIVVRGCRIDGVEFGITFTRNDGDATREFFIADNEIIGPSTWPRTRGIEDARGIQATGAGHTIGYNRVRGFADGIDTFPSSRCAAIDIHNNEISEMTDDGIETDYSERNVRCFENRLTNVFQGISAQPVHGGPVYLFRNVLYNVEVETFKLHNSPSGALIFHNTSVKKGEPLVLWTSNEVRRCLSRNNLFVGTPSTYAFDCTAPMRECDFDFDGFAGGPWGHFLRWNTVRYRTLEEVRVRAPVYRHARQIDAAGLFASGLRPPSDHRALFDCRRVDVRLGRQCAAIDAGQRQTGLNDRFAGRAPDLGAIESGDPLPHYGPRGGEGTRGRGGASDRADRADPTDRTRPVTSSPLRPLAASPSRAFPGVVSFVKVLSHHVEDVSSMEAWRRSVLRPGMSDQEKALAIWETVVRFRHQDPPPREWPPSDACVHDAIKSFNVYGYGMCCCASANIAALGRAVGLPARGRILSGHSVPELFWDGAWRMLDASLINYFPKADGRPASVDELIAGVSGWLAARPDLKGNDAALRAFMRGGGWRRGPEILARYPFYDENGWLPAATHGWYSTMQEYDGSATGFYEYGYSEGYRVNVQLRPGERLTRRGSNRGLHVNAGAGDGPGCLQGEVGRSDLRYTPRHGDLAPGRVGNGTYEWEVPLAEAVLRACALSISNLGAPRTGPRVRTAQSVAPSIRLLDAARPGVLILRVPSSYILLGGEALLRPRLSNGARIEISLSNNHGREWRPVATITRGGELRVDLKRHLFGRYDYRLRVVMRGPGAALERLRLTHDIQHSQRALPALAQGRNRITVSAGPPEGTMTVEGSLESGKAETHLTYRSFNPHVTGLRDPWLAVTGAEGQITFPIATPGDLTRLRVSAHYRARAPEDAWEIAASFDDGRTFRRITRLAGPTAGHSQSATLTAVPPGTRGALVRWRGTRRNTTCLFGLRIDADYREPHGGFAPLRVTYAWEEGGVEKRHVHVARRPTESYTIDCADRPRLRWLTVEHADRARQAIRDLEEIHERNATVSLPLPVGRLPRSGSFRVEPTGARADR